MPWIVPVPRTVRPSPLEVHLGAHLLEDPAQRVAGLGGAARPVGDSDAATTGQGQHQEGGGVGQVRLDGHVARCDRTGGDPPAVGVAVVDLDAACAQTRHRHLDVRQRRHRLAVVADVDTLVEPRGGEQQGGHELARGGRVDHDRPARDRAGCRRPRRGAGPRRWSRPRRARAAHRAPPPSAASGRAGRRRRRCFRAGAGQRPAGRTASRCRPARSRSPRHAGRRRRCRARPASRPRRCRPVSRASSALRPSGRCPAIAAPGVRRRAPAPAPRAPARGWSGTWTRAAARARRPA